MKSVNKKHERIGEVNKNRYGNRMILIDYISNNNIIVKFDNGEIKNTRYYRFRSGEISCLNDKSIYNVGYIGVGKFKATMNGKITKEYDCWNQMIRRCYSEKYQKKYTSYIGCKVCEEWHNFQNFSKWYHENFYIIDGEQMHLDKDILLKGNKIYSPSTCTFIPERINVMFTKTNSRRGEYPIGVSFKKENKKYQSSCQDGEREIYLGLFDTQIEAFEKYKEYKEMTIKKVAKEYKEYIPKEIYLAMINYKVEITD